VDSRESIEAFLWLSLNRSDRNRGFCSDGATKKHQRPAARGRRFLASLGMTIRRRLIPASQQLFFLGRKLAVSDLDLPLARKRRHLPQSLPGALHLWLHRRIAVRAALFGVAARHAISARRCRDYAVHRKDLRTLLIRRRPAFRVRDIAGPLRLRLCLSGLRRPLLLPSRLPRSRWPVLIRPRPGIGIYRRRIAAPIVRVRRIVAAIVIRVVIRVGRVIIRITVEAVGIAPTIAEAPPRKAETKATAKTKAAVTKAKSSAPKVKSSTAKSSASKTPSSREGSAI